MFMKIRLRRVSGSTSYLTRSRIKLFKLTPMYWFYGTCYHPGVHTSMAAGPRKVLPQLEILQTSGPSICTDICTLSLPFVDFWATENLDHILSASLCKYEAYHIFRGIMGVCLTGICSLWDILAACIVKHDWFGAIDIFQQLTVGGTKYPAFQFIRQGTQYNSPVTDLTSTDLRCNFGGTASKGTITTTIKAGDPFTFTLDTAVYHQGPTSM